MESLGNEDNDDDDNNNNASLLLFSAPPPPASFLLLPYASYTRFNRLLFSFTPGTHFTMHAVQNLGSGKSHFSRGENISCTYFQELHGANFVILHMVQKLGGGQRTHPRF
jgi:hypothetical protein